GLGPIGGRFTDCLRLLVCARVGRRLCIYSLGDIAHEHDHVPSVVRLKALTVPNVPPLADQVAQVLAVIPDQSVAITQVCESELLREFLRTLEDRAKLLVV